MKCVYFDKIDYHTKFMDYKVSVAIVALAS